MCVRLGDAEDAGDAFAGARAADGGAGSGGGGAEIAASDRWEPSFYIEGKARIALCTIRFVRYAACGAARVAGDPAHRV